MSASCPAIHGVVHVHTDLGLEEAGSESADPFQTVSHEYAGEAQGLQVFVPL